MDNGFFNNFQDETLLWIHSWPDGLIALNHSNQIVFTNPEVTNILGWDEGNVLGKHIHDVLCVKSREYLHAQSECPLCLSHSEKAVSSSVWQNSEGYNTGVDYRVIAMASSTQISCILSFQSNLDAEHSQNELERFAEYVDKNPEPVVEFDCDGQMVFSNSSMQEQLLNNGFNEFGEARIFPENIASICQQCVENKEVIRNVEVELSNDWYRWQFHPMESNGYLSVMGYASTITEQKEMEQRIEVEKAEARRDFFAKMVHELRTPLNAIIGFSQVLLRRVDGVLPERDIKQLKSIRSAGLQLNEMISDTLDISKIEAGKMSLDVEAFLLHDVIDSFKEQVKSLAEAKKLTYQVSCKSDINMYSDLKKVRQIMINLISNAIKYTSQGEVTVIVVERNDSMLGNIVHVDVKDTGVGIPQDQIDTIFKAYNQVSEEKNKGIQGTGLGLALVSELTEMLQGRIKIVSEHGVGSTFSLILPLRI